MDEEEGFEGALTRGGKTNMTANKQPRVPEFIDGPAVLTVDYIQNRAFRNDQGKISQNKAWRRVTELDKAFVKGQLKHGNGRYSEKDRLEAGRRYADLCAICAPKGRDSTQALNISSGGFSGTVSIAQAIAAKTIVTVKSHLGGRDRNIIHMVCVEDAAPVDAIKHICGDYEKTVSARFREALDALIEAFETERRNPGTVNLEPRA